MARGEEFAHQVAPFAGAPDGGEQVGERGFVFGSGVLLQSAGEGQVLRFAVLGKPVGVGSQKGERPILVAFVLGEVEGHAAHRVPERGAGLEPRGEAGGGGLAGNVFAEFAPESGEQVGLQVLAAAHRRGLEGQGGEFGRISRQERGGGRFLADPGEAEPLEVVAGEVAPIHRGRRQAQRERLHAQEQQALGVGSGESRCDALRPTHIQAGSVVGLRSTASGSGREPSGR